MPKTKAKDEEKRKFICPDCGISLSSSYNLKVHTQSKCSTEKNFVCDICQSRFLTIHSLKTHIGSIHTTEKKFVCSHCGKAFASKGQLTVHERSHTKQKPFVCSVCSRAFSHRESLVTHSTVHTKIKPYLCENCQQTFSCVGNLIKHRKIRPTTCGLPVFTNKRICKRAGVKCEKGKASVVVMVEEPVIEEYIEEEIEETGEEQQVVYTDHQYVLAEEQPTMNTLKEMDVFDFIGIEIRNIQEQEERERQQQLEQVEEENFAEKESIEEATEDLELLEHIEIGVEGEFRCKLCPKIYQKRNISVNHLRREHGVIVSSFNYDTANRYRKLQKSPRWRCKFCPRKYISAKMAERHERVHGKSGKLIHKCPCCAIYFESVEEAETHQYEAHKERLVCDACEKRFDHPEKLISHKKYSHLQKKATIKKYSFMCTLCGRNFNTKVALSDHERSNCGKNPIYRCPYCDKFYHSAGSLKVHLTIHTAELNFECTFCPKKFRTKGQLTVHNRSHLNIKPFKCTFADCNAEFAHRQSLETHKSVHTGIKRYECEKCSARFSCISNLLAHRRNRKKDCGRRTEEEMAAKNETSV